LWTKELHIHRCDTHESKVLNFRAGVSYGKHLWWIGDLIADGQANRMIDPDRGEYVDTAPPYDLRRVVGKKISPDGMFYIDGDSIGMVIRSCVTQEDIVHITGLPGKGQALAPGDTWILSLEPRPEEWYQDDPRPMP
jgi:hypothetical protein